LWMCRLQREIEEWLRSSAKRVSRKEKSKCMEASQERHIRSSVLHATFRYVGCELWSVTSTTSETTSARVLPKHSHTSTKNERPAANVCMRASSGSQRFEWYTPAVCVSSWIQYHSTPSRPSISGFVRDGISCIS
jgi:hypothetical protein